MLNVHYNNSVHTEKTWCLCIHPCFTRLCFLYQ